MTAAAQVHILLVDDLEENLLALEAVLRREDVALLKARSGQEALELLLERDVALALIDVQMPGIHGFELAELMRGIQRTRRVPIIFLTAGSTDQQRRFRGYEAGAVDFLQKPVEPDVLRSKTDVFVDLFRQRQEIARQRDELQAAMDENARLLSESQQFARALRVADRRKDEFLATLAHELRNPLAPILNAVQVLQFIDLTGGEFPHIRDLIERQVRHLMRLVDDLLDVSRITQDKIELQRRPVTLKSVVQHAIETSALAIGERNHEFVVELSDSPLTVNGDLVRLTQVLANLLNNAAKYTPPSGRITLTLERDADWAVIRVRDTGLGIPAEMLARVFEMFTQVKEHQTQSHGGLGIGLTLAKVFVEMHGGTIRVHSAGEGTGTEFVVRLPLLQPHAAAGSSKQSAQPTETGGRRVLIIDDNGDAARTVAMLLESLGHSVAVATDGPAGLAMLAEQPMDAVLLDLGMPGMDGYETAQRIRELPAGRDVVLVALTGWGEDDVHRRLEDVGFDHHLLKPVDFELLSRILAERAPSSGRNPR